LLRLCLLVACHCATRGLADMRGLVTAGRAVRLEPTTGLRADVTTVVDLGTVVVHS
jgi:hypothetical protein